MGNYLPSSFQLRRKILRTVLVFRWWKPADSKSARRSRANCQVTSCGRTTARMDFSNLKSDWKLPSTVEKSSSPPKYSNRARRSWSATTKKGSAGSRLNWALNRTFCDAQEWKQSNSRVLTFIWLFLVICASCFPSSPRLPAKTEREARFEWIAFLTRFRLLILCIVDLIFWFSGSDGLLEPTQNAFKRKGWTQSLKLREVKLKKR